MSLPEDPPGVLIFSARHTLSESSVELLPLPLRPVERGEHVADGHVKRLSQRKPRLDGAV